MCNQRGFHFVETHLRCATALRKHIFDVFPQSGRGFAETHQRCAGAVAVRSRKQIIKAKNSLPMGKLIIYTDRKIEWKISAHQKSHPL
jgi:hypothetical protein